MTLLNDKKEFVEVSESAVQQDIIAKPRRSKFADKIDAPLYSNQKSDHREDPVRSGFRNKINDEPERKSKFAAFSIQPMEFKPPGLAPKKPLGFSLSQKIGSTN